jgi:cytochrome c2
MKTPFFILVGVIGLYALSKDLPNLEAVLALYRTPQQDGQVSGGEVFRKCAICHSLVPGDHRIGPSLHCILGARIAAQPGYRYSTGLRTAQLDSAFGPYEPEVWTRETLTAYVMDPALTFGNTRMPFPGLLATVPDDQVFDVTLALVDHLEQSCSSEAHELVALQPRRAGTSRALSCITIARHDSHPACREMAQQLRAGDNAEDPSLPALACIPPGRLTCDGTLAGE